MCAIMNNSKETARIPRATIELALEGMYEQFPELNHLNPDRVSETYIDPDHMPHIIELGDVDRFMGDMGWDGVEEEEEEEEEEGAYLVEDGLAEEEMDRRYGKPWYKKEAKERLRIAREGIKKLKEEEDRKKREQSAHVRS